jgi:hypothetical protein
VIDACFVLAKTETIMTKQNCIHAHFGTCWATSQTNNHRHTRQFQQDGSVLEWQYPHAASVPTGQNTDTEWQYNETCKSQRK